MRTQMVNIIHHDAYAQSQLRCLYDLLRTIVYSY